MKHLTDLVGAAFDGRSLDALKRVAKQDQRAGMQAAAKQLEGLFVQMMLKSMRDATPKDGLFSSQQSEMFTSMLDQQLAQEMAEPGKIGFASMMLKTLGGSAGAQSGTHVTQPVPLAQQLPPRRATFAAPYYSLHRTPVERLPEEMPEHSSGPVLNNANFISRMAAPAMAAARESGLPHQLILAQAALESGWGNREIQTREGKPSHNLFAIKAGPDWKGESTEITTTEYVDGVARKVKALFRVYSSYSEALSDYAALLTGNPRYRQVVAADSPEKAAHALQAGGYATDPDYAKKLTGIIRQIKGRLQDAASAYKNDLSALF